MEAQERRRLQDDRASDQAAGPDEQRTDAGDHAIRKAKTWRALPRAVDDQQLLFDEHGFGDDGPNAAGPGEPNDGRQHVQQKDS
jgi:hypothetical protein